MSAMIPGLYGLDSYSAWRTFSKDPQKYLDRFSQDKTVQKEVEYFAKKAPTFENVDALLKDRRALQYVLDSYGLSSEINNVGRLKKILTEDPTAEGSLANRLADPKFAAMANSLRLDQGMDKLKRGTFIDLVKDKYIQNEFEVALGEQDPALRQAAYFARSSGSISDVYQVLGDNILWKVTTAAFNIPDQFAIQSVETQAKYLSSRIDFTKFSGIAGSTSTTANQLARAKTDYSLLESSLAVSDKAVAQVKKLQEQLNQLSTDYANVSSNTDPGGANAATIALQNAAVPQLIRYEQLLQAGSQGLAGIDRQLGFLSDFIEQAKVPGADLASLKSQFSAFVSGINTTIANAEITAPDGSTQNILANGSNDTISVVLDDQGTTVTINRYDASNIQGALASAESAFNAITDSSDLTNIYAAQGRILVAQDQSAAIGATLDADISAFETTVGKEPFYASVNTVQLQKGSASVNDSLARITQIEDLLEKIGDIAAESRNRDSVSDRSDLEAKFTEYKDQIRDLIENASDPGLDNFLNNIPDQSYEINAGNTIQVKGGYNLAATISDVLDTGSLSDQTAAAALEIKAIQVSTGTDTAKAGLLKQQPILDHALNTYDPRGSLDSQIYKMRAELESLISGAASADGKQNLLSADQKNISLALTTGVNVTLRAQTTFKNDLTVSLYSLVAQAAGGDPSAILAALNDSLYLVDSTMRSLSGDNRIGTMELGKLGGIIDTLEPTDTADTENPYKMNAYTEKFLVRYLSQTASATAVSGPNSYVLSLFGGGSSNNSSAFSSIMSLSMQV